MCVSCRKRFLNSGFSTKIILGDAALAILLAPCAFAQTPTAPATAAPAQAATQNGFAAVSIHAGGRKFFNSGWYYLDPDSRVELPKDGLIEWNVPLNDLITFAYDLHDMQTRKNMLQTLPKWAQNEWYVVQARVEGLPTRAETRPMVRALLAERFKFSAHSEMRETDVYAMTFAHPGKQLSIHTPGTPCTEPVQTSVEVKSPFPYPSYKQVPAHCGVFNRQITKYQRQEEILDVSAAQLAEELGNCCMNAPVIDKSGSKEHYDAVLDYGQLLAAPANDPYADLGIPPQAAIEKQLGLKLTKQKAQRESFIVDHIEPLAEN